LKESCHLLNPKPSIREGVKKHLTWFVRPDTFIAVMKNNTLLINIIAEYFQSIFEKIYFRKHNPSFLAYSVVTFTNEFWLDGIVRQGRLMEQLYYYKPLDTYEGSDRLLKVA
jgi:hypothetical protein